MTRDELHSEPSALRIDDRDQTSRHSSPQYTNGTIALRGPKTIKKHSKRLTDSSANTRIKQLCNKRLIRERDSIVTRHSRVLQVKKAGILYQIALP